ncbi:cell wall-binding repeat-containing protein, partial [Kineococcus sp. G2]|uniref:cell wall-binding repeat-containing protein n=1 Tax=Kineococcus sp. G2 TaxID=3127484 RepID=UPI00301CC662
MTAATSRLRRRGIGAGVAALVGLTTVGFSSSAFAAPGFTADRVFGDNRFETAANIALETFPDGVSTAVLVNAYSPADALSAAALAGSLDAAVLLTDQGSLNADTEDALEVLGVENVVVVGGAAAVSAEQYRALDATYAVERVFGADRVATAVDVLGELSASPEASNQAFVVRAFGNPADSLAAGPIAYANGIPILPVAGAVDEAWINAVREAGIDTVTVLGGTAAVPASVEESLRDADFTVNDRVFGASGQATAAELARIAVSEWGFSNTGVGIARGDTTEVTNAADALTSSQWLGTQQFPLLLTQGNGVLGDPAANYLRDNSGTLVAGAVFGGTAAVAPEVVEAVEDAAQGEAPPTNQAFSITANDDAVVNEGGEVTYTVSGVPAGDVTIALAEASAVTVTDGTVTFEDNDGAAELGSVAARVISVNDTVVSSPSAIVTTEVEAGTFTFTVVGGANAEEAIVPVIFVDGEDDGLDVGDDGAPVDDFGVGPATTFATVTGLVATSATPLRQYGTTYTQTVQLVTDTNDEDGNPQTAPYAGESIVFQVLRGGTAVNTQVVTTDATGTASFSYTLADPDADSSNQTVDTVLAWIDSNGDRVNGGDEPDVTSTVTWTDAAAATRTLDLEAEAEFAQVASASSVSATVTDQYGNPLVGEDVVFTITRTDNAGVETVVGPYTRTSNADGVATLRYTGPVDSATDVVTAGVNTDDDADLEITQGAPTSVTWYEEAEESAAAQTGTVLAANTEANTLYANVGGTVLQFNYGSGQLFAVGGDGRTLDQFEAAITDALSQGAPLTFSVTNYLVDDAVATFNLEELATLQGVTSSETNGAALDQGDSFTLNFSDAVTFNSSVTLVDADGTSVTLTDDAPNPTAVFAAAGENAIRVTVAAGVNVAAFDPTNVRVTALAGIADADTNTPAPVGPKAPTDQPPAEGGDTDGDGVNDDIDAFPLNPAESVDTDEDGIGNNADDDDDNDTVADADDALPLDVNESVDTDKDGIGNNADGDDDNDTCADADDALPLDVDESVDTDKDGIGNSADGDDDNDTCADADDALPLDVDESVDTDKDGIGNSADGDDDNDTVAAADDAFPLAANESVDTDKDGTGNRADLDDDNDTVADADDA